MEYAQVDKPRLHTLTIADLFTCGQLFISCFQWFPIKLQRQTVRPRQLVSCTSSHAQLWLKLLLRNLQEINLGNDTGNDTTCSFRGSDIRSIRSPADWASGSHLFAPASVVNHGQPWSTMVNRRWTKWHLWPTAGGYTVINDDP